jgi:hypothetical protein
MNERTFLEHEGLRVTSTSFEANGQTFAMSNVTSVTTAKRAPNRVWPFLLLVAGVAGVAYNPLLGLPAAAAALCALFWQKTTYHVILHTPAGDTKAFSTHQKGQVSKVASALNEALLYRK